MNDDRGQYYAMRGWVVLAAVAVVGLSIAWWATGDSRFGAFAAVSFFALIIVAVPLVTELVEKKKYRCGCCGFDIQDTENCRCQLARCLVCNKCGICCNCGQWDKVDR